MAFADPQLVNFSLRGRPIDDLRSLAAQYARISAAEIAQMSKTDLVSQLSEVAASSKELSKELRKGSISLKPSFYLVRFSDEQKVKVHVAKNQISAYLRQHSSGLTNLKMQLVDELKDDLFQILFTWESSLNYWAPTFELAKVEQLQFGFSVLDYSVRKGIICCHTQKERDGLTKVLAAGFGTRFSSLVLTKPLLEQIGTFDRVKRALYVIKQTDANTPANITYADDNLAARSLAREEEESPRSQRAQSFYRISVMDPLVEEGVGATSESGKLWIPKEIPLESVRDYCTALLGRVSGTLDKLIKSDEIEAVLSTYKFDELPGVAEADPLAFRDALADLLRTLILMLSRKEAERAYTLALPLIYHGAPQFFFYPRLRLVDEATGEVGFWIDPATDSPQVIPIGSATELKLKSHPGHRPIDVDNLEHPITGASMALADVLGAIEFVPNESFLKIVRDAVHRVSEQLPKLKDVREVVFRLTGNSISLDIKRAFGDLASRPTLITASEIAELQPAIQRQFVSRNNREVVQAKLMKLGEKCVHMSDENCKACVKDRDKICLRSLLGRYLKGPQILAHKNIELCDMAGRGTIGGKDRRMWGFAKLPSSKGDGGLTLRNKPGAVLLAQVFGQIDRTTFKTVLIICPSSVNQDFQERAEVLCSAFGKELCFLDADDLGRLLLDFEEQAGFEGIDLKELYDYSSTKKRKKQTEPKVVT